MNSIPTEADWRSEPWCLDAACAYEHFLGKSIDQAVELLAENSLRYQEDILFMPVKCFRYYVQAYVAYLRSPASQHDAIGASCFIDIVELRLKDVRESVPELIESIQSTLEYVTLHQEWFCDESPTYRSFERKTARIVKNLTADRA